LGAEEVVSEYSTQGDTHVLKNTRRQDTELLMATAWPSSVVLTLQQIVPACQGASSPPEKLLGFPFWKKALSMFSAEIVRRALGGRNDPSHSQPR
jgi:hypothetical protein